jgi:hypothetical protein
MVRLTNPPPCSVTTGVTTAAAEFGQLPDMRSWLEGDLILTRAKDPSGTATQLIVATQRNVFPDPAHHSWTHAAVYIGDGRVIEADYDPDQKRRGVLEGFVASYVPAYELRLRRDSRLSPAERHLIVTYARDIEGLDYSLARAAELALISQRGSALLKQVDEDAEARPLLGFVCSDVYAFAYAKTVKRVAAPRGQPFQSPASLSDSENFQEVLVSWCKIPPDAPVVSSPGPARGKGK